MLTTPPALDHTSPEDDLRARFRPSDAQIALAVEILTTLPSVTAESRRPGGATPRNRGPYVAVVPLALPGKQRGWWTVGQPVRPVAGMWIGYTGAWDHPLDYGHARNAAEDAAQADLDFRGEEGTTAYVTIHPDGTWAVFGG